MSKSSQFSADKIFNKSTRHIFSVPLIVCLAVYALVLAFSIFDAGWLSDEILSTKEYMLSYYSTEPTIAMWAGVIIAAYQFKFLHSKKQCFTMLSFAMKREKLFLREAFIPLSLLVIITFIIKVFSLCLNILLLKSSSELLQLFLANLMLTLMPLIFSYTVTVGAMLFTGRTFEGIFTAYSVISLPGAFFSLVNSIFNFSLYGYAPYEIASDELFYEGYTDFSLVGNELSRVFSAIAPTNYFHTYETYYCTLARNGSVDIAPQIIKTTVWIVISLAAIFLMSKYFSKSFKPEYCGVKGKSKVALTLCSVSIPLSVATIFMPYEKPLSGTGVAVELLTAIVYSVIVAIILNMIAYRGVKKILCGVTASGIVLAVTLIVMGIGYTGAFGYTNYMPDAENVESVVVSLPFDEILPVDAYNDFYNTGSYPSTGTYIELESENDIEILQNIQSSAIQNRDTDTACEIQIIYTLKNGKQIPRTYTCMSTEAYDASLRLWETDRVREFYKIVLDRDDYYNSSLKSSSEWDKYSADFFGYSLFGAEDCTDESYWYYETYSPKEMVNSRNITIVSTDGKRNYTNYYDLQPEQIDALKAAVYEDISNLTVQQWFSPEKQLGILLFTGYIENYDGAYYDYGEGNSVKIPISSDMVKTIEMLEEMGLSEYLVNTRSIQKASVIDIDDLVEFQQKNSYYAYNYDIYDAEQIESLFENTPYLNKGYYSWDNMDNDSYSQIVTRYLDKTVKGAEESSYTEITPEEAEKLRDSALMACDASRGGKILAIKYSSTSYTILVIPE